MAQNNRISRADILGALKTLANDPNRTEFVITAGWIESSTLRVYVSNWNKHIENTGAVMFGVSALKDGRFRVYKRETGQGKELVPVEQWIDTSGVSGEVSKHSNAASTSTAVNVAKLKPRFYTHAAREARGESCDFPTLFRDDLKDPSQWSMLYAAGLSIEAFTELKNLIQTRQIKPADGFNLIPLVDEQQRTLAFVHNEDQERELNLQRLEILL